MALLRPACIEPRCPSLAAKGSSYCADHRRERVREWDREKRDPAIRRIYNSARWRAVRKLKLGRAPVCELCGDEPATEVHHLTPLRDGGRAYSMSNLASACSSCHAKESAKERQERRSSSSSSSSSSNSSSSKPVAAIAGLVLVLLSGCGKPCIQPEPTVPASPAKEAVLPIGEPPPEIRMSDLDDPPEAPSVKALFSDATDPLLYRYNRMVRRANAWAWKYAQGLNDAKAARRFEKAFRDLVDSEAWAGKALRPD